MLHLMCLWMASVCVCMCVCNGESIAVSLWQLYPIYIIVFFHRGPAVGMSIVAYARTTERHIWQWDYRDCYGHTIQTTIFHKCKHCNKRKLANGILRLFAQTAAAVAPEMQAKPLLTSMYYSFMSHIGVCALFITCLALTNTMRLLLVYVSVRQSSKHVANCLGSVPKVSRQWQTIHLSCLPCSASFSLFMCIYVLLFVL